MAGTTKTIDYVRARRKVDQSIGSMAISGAVVSRKVKADMLRIATGKKSATEVKRQIIAKYKQ